MSRLGKICFAFAGLTLLCFVISKFLISAWIPFFWVLLGLAVVFIGTGTFVDRKFFGEFFSLKTTKHGMNMGVLILGFIALVVTVNILGVRKVKTWDFSVNQLNSLADQSIKILNDLKEELKVVYLYKKNSQNYDLNRRTFTELIRRYQDQSERIQLEFYDADARPDMAEKYQFKGEQAVFLDYRGKKNRVDKISEQEITSALVKLTREKNKTVYFTSGHGEPENESLEKAEGLGHLKQLLENNNYSVKSLNLSASGKIPEDLDVLFVVSPQYPFQKMEVEALEMFLKGGGSLFVTLSFPDKSGLAQLLSKVGVEVQNNFIVNVLNSPMGAIIDPGGPTKGSKFSPNHPITKVFSKNDGVLFVKPIAVRKLPQTPASITVETLVEAPSSMSFTDSAMKTQGPLADYSLAVAAQGVFPGAEAGKTFNVVVAGDSHFLENQLLYSFVNRDMVLNSLALLAKEENLISITPKEPTGEKIELTTAKEAVLVWGFLLPLPIIFLVSSLVYWVRRRHA